MHSHVSAIHVIYLMRDVHKAVSREIATEMMRYQQSGIVQESEFFSSIQLLQPIASFPEDA